jgi:ribosome-binding protein aMBF1 (putative translation factor)
MIMKKEKAMSLEDVFKCLDGARKKLGWTPTKLARKAGVHVIVVYAIEKGNLNIAFCDFIAVANVLGFNVSFTVD